MLMMTLPIEAQQRRGNVCRERDKFQLHCNYSLVDGGGADATRHNYHLYLPIVGIVNWLREKP